MSTEMTKALQKRKWHGRAIFWHIWEKNVRRFLLFFRSNLLKQRPILQNINYMTSTRKTKPRFMVSSHSTVFSQPCWRVSFFYPHHCKEKHFPKPRKASPIHWNDQLWLERSTGLGKSLITEYLKIHYRRRKWQPTPVFLPGESQGQRSLVGCHLWGHKKKKKKHYHDVQICTKILCISYVSSAINHSKTRWLQITSCILSWNSQGWQSGQSFCRSHLASIHMTVTALAQGSWRGHHDPTHMSGIWCQPSPRCLTSPPHGHVSSSRLGLDSMVAPGS